MSIFAQRLKYWQSIWLSIIGGNLLCVFGVNIVLAQPVPLSLFELDEYLDPELNSGIDNSPTESQGEAELIADIFPPLEEQPPKIKSFSRVVASQRLQPSTTNWIFNGVPVNHRTSQDLKLGSETGSHRNFVPSVNGVINLGGETREQLDRQGIYSLDYRTTFGQVQTLRQSRQVSTDVTQPSTMNGFRERLTLTADCSLPGVPATSQCSYLAGLVTDRTSLDANQQPTRIDRPSQFGDVVTPRSLAAIKEPGFSAGVDGQFLGVDLEYPNAGIEAGNGQSQTTLVNRQEQIQQTPALALGRFHQRILVNDRAATIGRTIRGNAVILGDRNLAIATGLQLLTESLPEAIPALPGATTDRLPTINRNLFKAPDLARIPDNSLSLYQYGIGFAPHAAEKVAKLTDIPPATYQAWWIGLSPVVTRTQANRSTIQLTGAQRIVKDVGQEGGIGDNVNIQSSVNGIQFDARQLKNVYQQAYVTVYNQDVTLFTNSNLTEKTQYAPHFSYTGNITNSDRVLRYYAGAIVDRQSRWSIDRLNTYAGLDYSHINENGLTTNLAGIMYTSPDPDYHSYAIGSVSKKFNFSPKNNLTLSAKLDYIADGELQIDRTLFQSANSSIGIGASTNLDRLSFGISQSFASGLPNSIQNTLATSLALRLSDNITISGYWTPWNENPIRSPYGINANLRWGNSADSPSLNLGWSQNTTTFGRDSLNRSIEQTDRLFTVLFKLK